MQRSTDWTGAARSALAGIAALAVTALVCWLAALLVWRYAVPVGSTLILTAAFAGFVLVAVVMTVMLSHRPRPAWACLIPVAGLALLSLVVGITSTAFFTAAVTTLTLGAVPVFIWIALWQLGLAGCRACAPARAGGRARGHVRAGRCRS